MAIIRSLNELCLVLPVYIIDMLLSTNKTESVSYLFSFSYLLEENCVALFAGIALPELTVYEDYN